VTVLIGVDCATVPERTGIALGHLQNARLTLDAVHAPDRGLDVEGIIVAALATGGPAVLALDAPLGWPSALGDELADHRAGAPLRAAPAALFSRATDHAIRARLGKQPLEVGADRIARTAVAALGLLDRVRSRSGRVLPVAVDGTRDADLVVLEVYPAALVAAGNPRPRGQEAVSAAKVNAARMAFGEGLTPHMATLEGSPDALDATLCVLAAADWVLGRAIPPPPELTAAARREGWIWAR
jgi:hypothetical protein